MSSDKKTQSNNSSDKNSSNQNSSDSNSSDNNPSVSLKLNKILEVNSRDVTIGQAAAVWSSDDKVAEQIRSLKLTRMEGKNGSRKVISALDLLSCIDAAYPDVTAETIGEADFILEYRDDGGRVKTSDICKTIIVAVIAFCGAAFAIMTFNNDADVANIFQKLYQMATGEESSGFTVLEAGYSLGLPVGILVFFNHFNKKKVLADPTPIEVQMRLYEEDVTKTLINNVRKKGGGPDAH